MLLENVVVVTGIGLLSCLGSLRESWQSLLAGKSGIARHQPFAELPPYPLGMLGPAPISLTDLVGRVVAAALEDGGWEPPLADWGVALGSSRGPQAVWERFAAAPGGISPILAGALPHQGAIAAARQIGSQGPVLSPMAACATGIWAIAQGAELIRQGRCQRVLAGAVEAPITPLTLAGFERMGALATTGCYPFDRRRQGLVLGEGGAAFLLERGDLALKRGATIYGQVLGFGLTCDACHVSAPAPDNRIAMAAVRHCLQGETVDYIHPHGTGTALNDRREAELIASLFPDGVPVSSTKGATGHTLGASGALGAAFCLMALQQQQLPPCVGLQEPEFALDFVLEPRPWKVRRALCLSFGFGGQNAAIALGF